MLRIFEIGSKTSLLLFARAFLMHLFRCLFLSWPFSDSAPEALSLEPRLVAYGIDIEPDQFSISLQLSAGSPDIQHLLGIAVKNQLAEYIARSDRGGQIGFYRDYISLPACFERSASIKSRSCGSLLGRHGVDSPGRHYFGVLMVRLVQQERSPHHFKKIIDVAVGSQPDSDSLSYQFRDWRKAPANFAVAQRYVHQPYAAFSEQLNFTSSQLYSLGGKDIGTKIGQLFVEFYRQLAVVGFPAPFRFVAAFREMHLNAGADFPG